MLSGKKLKNFGWIKFEIDFFKIVTIAKTILRSQMNKDYIGQTALFHFFPYNLATGSELYLWFSKENCRENMSYREKISRKMPSCSDPR